jgi:hypothetical protein
MYSKEQMSTRLKLGSTLNIAELALVVKSIFEKLETLENEIKELKNDKSTQLSADRRTTSNIIGEDIQTSSIQSGFKL